jgi:hypothetical protein
MGYPVAGALYVHALRDHRCPTDEVWTQDFQIFSWQLYETLLLLCCMLIVYFPKLL